MIVLVAGAAVGIASLTGGGSSTAAPSLPRHIGAPSMYAGSSPIGAAGVAFSSDQWSLDGTIDSIALTGAKDDAYRRLSGNPGSTAGLNAILSPDGRRLAVQDGIVDLATDAVTRLAPTGGDFRDPQAWSPDGRYLATVTFSQVGDAQPSTFTGEWTDAVSGAQLDVVDTTNGVRTHIADLDMTAVYDSWIAAFAPAGDRIAYQSGNRVDVASLTGAAISGFTVPEGTRIAGKGAWTPDGQSLALVAESACTCGSDYDARWTLTTVDASTGTARQPGYTVDGTVAIRMLGWSPAGEPVVVSYDPESPDNLDPVAQIVDFRTHSQAGVDQTGVNLDGIELLGNVSTARVLALRPGAAPRVLLQSTSTGAESLDVADNVIAGGLDRPGNPPLLTEDFIVSAGIIAVLVLLVGAVAVAITMIRKRRSRGQRPVPALATPPASAAEQPQTHRSDLPVMTP